MPLNTREWLEAGFNFVSCLFYLLFLATLIKHRNKTPFNSAFFKICLWIGVTDLLSIAHSYALMRLPEYGVMHSFYMTYNRGALAKYAVFSNWLLMYAQHWGVLLLTINRFTAIRAATSYKYIWQRCLNPGLALVYIVSLVQTLPLLWTGFHFNYTVCERDEQLCANGTNGRYQLIDSLVPVDRVDILFDDRLFEVVGFLIGAVFNMGINVSVFVMYVIIFVTLWKKNRKVTGMPSEASTVVSGRGPVAANDEKRKEVFVEIRLALAGFILSVTMLFFFCTLLMAGLMPLDDNPFFFLVYLAQDVLSVTNPYIICMMSKAVRDAMKALLTK